MGSESIAHEAEGAIDSEAMNARGIIVWVKSNQLVKKISRLNIFRKWKLDLNPLPLKHYKYDGRFSLLVGYNMLKIKVENVAESAKIVTNVQTFRDCALHQRNVR